MRTLGLIGGMSPASTTIYYDLLNAEIAARLGGHHSCRLLLHSVDFGEIEAGQRAGDWDGLAATLAAAAQGLERAGAEAILICANTMHRCAPAVQAAVDLPLVHILDALAHALDAAGVTTVGVLGTGHTMEGPLYPDHLGPRGIDVLVPGETGRRVVHTVIYDELCHGIVRDASRDRYREVIGDLVDRGATGIVLGCTELALLIGEDDSPVPVFDTAALHVRAAVDWALS